MLVSVIIPTFNRPFMVKQAIDSVLNQTYKDIELIVVNDGSTDNTQHILQNYGNKIRVLNQDNKGLNFSRNRAVRESKGKYIALLDDDDLWRPFKLDLQVQLMEKYDHIPFLFSEFTIFKDTGENKYPGLQSWFKEPKDWAKIFHTKTKYHYNCELFDTAEIYIGNIYAALLSDPLVLPTTAMIRKSAIPDGIEFIEGDPMCGDWDFFARLSRENDIIFINNDIALNRSHREFKRYTMSPPEFHVKSRLNLLDRVWKKDAEFCKNYQPEINYIEAICKLGLIESEIMASQKPKVNKLLSDYVTLGGEKDNLKYRIFKLINLLPAGKMILKLIRKLQLIFF
jgi:glycosyltransferase involved in cell wall biosynthesis